MLSFVVLFAVRRTLGYPLWRIRRRPR
jgi:hypothetical protein